MGGAGGRGKDQWLVGVEEEEEEEEELCLVGGDMGRSVVAPAA